MQSTSARLTPGPRRGRALPRLIGGMIAATVAVLLTVQAAVAVPGERRLADVADMAALDYSALQDQVSPLSADYIAQVLGRTPAVGPSTADGTEVAATAPISESRSGPRPAATPPVAVPAPSPPRSNDDIADAEQIDGLPYRHWVSASSASREAADPGDCMPAGGTYWYRWTAPADGVVVATATRTLAAPTTLGVFTRDDSTTFREEACGRGVLGARAPVAADAGQTYWFQMTVPTGLGRIAFAVVPLAPAREVRAPVQPTYDPPVRECVGCNYDELGRPYTRPRFHLHDITRDGSEVIVDTELPLDERDTNNRFDLYAIDLSDGHAELITVSADGRGAGDRSTTESAAVSADGRFVAFASDATNLTADLDTNLWIDVFVRDRVLQTTERVSVHSNGDEGQAPPPDDDEARQQHYDKRGPAEYVDISDDGQLVVFSTDLQLHGDDPLRLAESHPDRPQDAGHLDQVDAYVRDRRQGTTELLVTHPDRWFTSTSPTISGDGSTVAFTTDAPLLGVDGDLTDDVYVRDLATGGLRLATLTRSGPAEAGDDVRGNGHAWGRRSLGADGRHLTFVSSRAGLIDGDGNDGPDVFVTDLVDGTIRRASVATGGVEQVHDEEASDLPMLQWSTSDDGRFTVFVSRALNLTSAERVRTGVRNGLYDAFLHDRDTQITTLISAASDGRPAAFQTASALISGDGRTVVMASGADLSGDGRWNRVDDPALEELGGPPHGIYVRRVDR